MRKKTQNRKLSNQSSGFKGRIKLSKSTIDKIGFQLHEDIQFYDEKGDFANAEFIQKIEDSLSGAGQPSPRKH